MTVLAEMLHYAGMELISSRYMPPEPALEPELFSGGANMSARERNRKALAEACKVYSVLSMPNKLFCSVWVHEVLLAGLAADADDRIDALYARLWQLEQSGGRGSRGFVAMSWKIETAERLRAGQMSRHFWKRNPRSEVALIDDSALSGVRATR